MPTLIPTDLSESLLTNISNAYHATTEAFLRGDLELMADGLTMLQDSVTLCNERIREHLGFQDSRVQ